RRAGETRRAADLRPAADLRRAGETRRAADLQPAAPQTPGESTPGVPHQHAMMCATRTRWTPTGSFAMAAAVGSPPVLRVRFLPPFADRKRAALGEAVRA